MFAIADMTAQGFNLNLPIPFGRLDFLKDRRDVGIIGRDVEFQKLTRTWVVKMTISERFWQCLW